MKKSTMTDKIKDMELTGGMPLLKKIPMVLRARNFRLYLSNGKRLVDLWLNGGAAVLGHTPSNLLRVLKNTAARGLYSPLPHFTEARFIKALSRIFPNRSFRLYAALPQELQSQIKNIDKHVLNGFSRLNNEDKKSIADVQFWRPFTDPDNPFAVNDETPLLLPILPGIQTWRDGLPFGLCVAASSAENLSRLPQSDTFSPILLAAAARGIYNLLAACDRAKPSLPKTANAIKNNSRWERNGIYITLKENITPAEWEALFNKFLEAGFLLPPDPAYPIILPGELSAGEDAKLAKEINF